MWIQTDDSLCNLVVHSLVQIWVSLLVLKGVAYLGFEVYYLFAGVEASWYVCGIANQYLRGVADRF